MLQPVWPSYEHWILSLGVTSTGFVYCALYLLYPPIYLGYLSLGSLIFIPHIGFLYKKARPYALTKEYVEYYIEIVIVLAFFKFFFRTFTFGAMTLLTVAIISFHQKLLEDTEMVGYNFHGYQRIGKVVAVVLMFSGNIVLYYYSGKSVASIFVFFSLAFYCLCVLFLIQPCSDSGVVEFFLSASLNQALSIFGIRHVFFWFVFFGCISMAGLRYWVEPTKPTFGHETRVRV